MATKSEPNILYEGPCAYAVCKARDVYDIMVYSSNSVTHVLAGVATSEAQAERVTRRLNAYPRQTRQAHGLM